MPGNMHKSYTRRITSGSDVERTTFFSDAVFAIAMTLVAVDIKIPQVPDGDLGRAVAEQWPEFAAYLLSFAVAGTYWLSHHRLFRLLKGFTAGLQRLNLVLLFFIGLLSYATDMLAFHSDQVIGVVIYAATLGLIGAANTSLWLYAGRQRMFKDDVDARLITYARVRAPVTPAVFLLSIPVAFLNPLAGILIWLAIPLINLGLRLWGRKLPGPELAAD
ncbi:TMEM175 family protein [Arthrobacter sp. ATA002]|uniref:TMEM175 family protein n=1 Tax=Arthrobacter sp. ATA002 TaxID=2991715 RepID=UPI0022A75688|nr:TMEM175 family protein [Arthrobacter sp. ATA002]WAP51818.1 TMEM175 family protein [Arthrobacter sp. ATA002]